MTRIHKILLVLLLFSPAKAVAQNDSVQIIESDSVARIYASNVIHALSNPVLYIGLDNPISIEIPNAKPESIHVTSDDEHFRFIGNGKAIVSPTSVGYCTITATWENEKGDAFQKTQKFKKLGLPKLTFEVTQVNDNGELKRFDIGMVDLRMYLKEFLWHQFFNIHSYSIKIGDQKAFTVKSGNLTRKVYRKLKKAKHSTKVIIFDVRVSSNPRTCRTSMAEFTIVD